MAAQRPSAADVIVAALSPLLIMGVVGSLVFFLAEVFYSGRYEDRLLYTLFFFVIGAVLVGRIAVVVDRSRAWGYAGILALVTFIALKRWVEFPEDSPVYYFKDLINIVLIGVVWWASNRLVWDCTFIDDNRTGSGKGLLSAAGWEKRPEARPDLVDDAVEDESHYSPGMAGWYERFDSWRKARSKKPHTPGLTIVYFALAALPIFGLGQALIPADDAARRSFTFKLAAVYVSSSLGLLVTTSFLGLRRYLRQRKLNMPLSMTASWMGLGAVLIVAFVLVGSLIPRPYSETPIWNPRGTISAEERNASKYAMNRDSAGKGEGRTGDQATKGDGKATGKGGEPGAKGKSGEAKQGSGDKQGKQGSGDDKQGKQQGDSKEGKQGDQSKQADSKDSGREANSKNNPSNKDSGSKANQQQSSPNTGALSKIASALKWIVFAVLALVVLFVIFRHGLSFLANFMPWAKNLLASIDAWWKSLFGMKERKPASSGSSGETTTEREYRIPFDSFSNPFRDGTAAGRSPEDLVKYSFEAFEVWAAEQGHERRQDETPIEFASRPAFTSFEEEGRKLALLVARLAYTTHPLPNTTRTTLKEFWAKLEHAEVVEIVE